MEIISNIKQYNKELKEVRVKIIYKILISFKDESQILKLDDILYYLHFKNINAEDVYRIFISPLINKYLKIDNKRDYNFGRIKLQDIAFKLNPTNLNEINDFRYYKFPDIKDLSIKYENMLNKIDDHILSLLNGNQDGLTQKEIFSTLSEEEITCLEFEKIYIEHLFRYGKIEYVNYLDYTNGYISRWNLKVKLVN